MEDFTNKAKELVNSLAELFQLSGEKRISELLLHATPFIVQSGYDNWNGGTDIYELHLQLPISAYANISDELKGIENKISEKLQPIMRRFPNSCMSTVIISPALGEAKKASRKNYTVSNDKLVKELEAQKSLMIGVSTGGQRIQSVNANYVDRQKIIDAGLEERLIKNPNPYPDLWAWYGKWSSGDLPTYQSRRKYISELFNSLIKRISESSKTRGAELFKEPTGWARVDRTIGEMRKRLEESTTEEQYQSVGLLCRETLISLAQLVFDPSKHCIQQNINISKTDAKKMLDAYLSVEIAGNTNETARKHAKAALDLANDLTHRRTANFRQAALCAEATTSVINIIAIISGQRNP